jgi:NADH-quinone oxidoreductase subunit C
MHPHLVSAVAALKERYFAQETDCNTGPSLLISADHIVPATTSLRDEFGFDFLSSQTASDYWPEMQPRFHIVYQIYSHAHNVRLSLRVPVDGSDPVVPSIEPLYPVANWHEREIWDMFGVRFEGHSDLRRILMPYDWVGHPLRKDYPLGYEEPQFTFNFEDIQARKHRGRYEEA